MNGGSYRGGLAKERRFGGDPGRNRSLIHTIITILLAIALIVTVILTVPSTRFRDEYREQTIKVMQQECSTAISTSGKLSRTGAYNSFEQLAEIRSGICCIEVLNDNYAALHNGQRLIDTETIANIKSMISDYYSQLTKTGSVTEQQTNLIAELEKLRDIVTALK